jgi:hypothetical protein
MQFTILKRSNLKRRAPRRKPGDVDREYVEWIKTLPCVACFLKLWGWEQLLSMAEPGIIMSEAHHAGDHPYARRAADRTCIPLCGFEHHREGPDSAHKLGKRFWAHHGIDRDALIRELNERYDTTH